MQFRFLSGIIRISKISAKYFYRRRKMAAMNELIRVESDGTISFGDYTLGAKAKTTLCQDGISYKVKTYKDITKLECNDVFVYESVPGTAVSNFNKQDTNISFQVQGAEDAQITLELEAESEYEIIMDGTTVGTMSTNLGGKLSMSVELAGNAPISIRVEKR